MMGSFKRKVYGKVRPVPKPKQKVPSKPSVNELKAIYTQIKRSPESALNDLLSEAFLWWAKAIPFVQHKYQKMFPLEASKAFLAAKSYMSAGQQATSNKLKADNFVIALNKFQRYGASVLKVPTLAPYLKASKEVTKKTNVRNKQLTERFDNVLTLLAKCFDEPSITLHVSDFLAEDRQWDHALSKVFYSRAHCVEMKKRIFNQGLLSVVLEEADFIARGLSLSPDVGRGSFLVNSKIHHDNYLTLLSRFEQFCHHPDSPKTLVKRDKRKR